MKKQQKQERATLTLFVLKVWNPCPRFPNVIFQSNGNISLPIFQRIFLWVSHDDFLCQGWPFPQSLQLGTINVLQFLFSNIYHHHLKKLKIAITLLKWLKWLGSVNQLSFLGGLGGGSVFLTFLIRWSIFSENRFFWFWIFSKFLTYVF